MKYKIQLADKYKNGYYGTSSLMYPEWTEVWEEVKADWFEVSDGGDLLLWRNNNNFEAIARGQWKRIFNEDTSRV